MSNQKIFSLLAISLIPLSLSTAPIEHSPKTKTSREISLPIPSKLLATPTPILKPKNTYVGKLHDKWQFPSDHLPIGMTFDDLHIASWNVLDAAYMNWVTEKDSQGLNGSMLTDEHVYIGDSALTIRDQHVADLVCEMIDHPTHPRSLISLQECSESFIDDLRSKLPSQFAIIFGKGNAVLVDQSHFQILEAKEISNVFSQQPSRTFQEISLERIDTGEKLCIFNVHLPGDPAGPARFEFGTYLTNHTEKKTSTIAMGDMNFNEFEMADALGKDSPFSIHSPYCTNISVKGSPEEFTSKAIDHFIASNTIYARLNTSETVLQNLDEFARLLNQ